jgi:hypothetical protein
MATVNDTEVEDLLGESFAWLPEAVEQVGCISPADSGLCKKAMKDTLALLFAESYHFVRFQVENLNHLNKAA